MFNFEHSNTSTGNFEQSMSSSGVRLPVKKKKKLVYWEKSITSKIKRQKRVKLVQYQLTKVMIKYKFCAVSESGGWKISLYLVRMD